LATNSWHGGQYKALADADVRRLHNVALDILSQVGTQVNNAHALDLFEEKGAPVCRETRIVKLPRGMVEDAIASAPSRVLLAGRDSRNDLVLEGTRVYLGTGGTALYVLDLNGQKRPSTLKDIAQIARLVDALDNIDFLVIPVYPNELEDKVQVDVNRFYHSLCNTTKHVQGGAYTLEGIREVVKIGESVAGGAEALRARPILSFIFCLISPLALDDEFTDFIMQVARRGLPIALSVEPLCGATAPVTLAGNLAQWAAEALSGVTLVQLVNPGSPCLPGYVGSITDLRTMDYLGGALEQGLLNAGVAQLAQYWGLPCYATGGMSDSKVLDAQSGYEGAMTNLMAALAGANFIHDAAGLMEFAMTASYEKCVIDDEIIGMVKRALRGIKVNDETIAQHLIAQVGPAGNYLAEPHTVEHMRDEFFFPTLSDREKREAWEEAGRRETREVANELARSILQEHRPVPLASDVEARIRSEIPLLVGKEQSKDGR
jgi:trimethylamine--corrinoid protein Co-methyltransferase